MSLSTELLGSRSAGDAGQVVTRRVVSLETTSARGEPVVRRLERERA